MTFSMRTNCPMVILTVALIYKVLSATMIDNLFRLIHFGI